MIEIEIAEEISMVMKNWRNVASTAINLNNRSYVSLQTSKEKKNNIIFKIF